MGLFQLWLIRARVDARGDKRPQQTGLHESGSIEQDAGAIIFVYREEYYLERLKPKEGSPEFLTWFKRASRAYGKAELIIGKHATGQLERWSCISTAASQDSEIWRAKTTCRNASSKYPLTPADCDKQSHNPALRHFKICNIDLQQKSGSKLSIPTKYPLSWRFSNAD